MDEDEDPGPIYVALAGGDLSAGAAGLLEDKLAKNDDDVDARLKLLGYWRQRGFTNDVARAKCNAQIRWFIEHDPENEIVGSPFAYVSADDPEFPSIVAAWDRVIERPDATPSAIYVAANFFRNCDRARSHALLLRGEQVAPDWSCWARELGEDLLMEVNVARNAEDAGHDPELTPGEIRDRAERALVQFERMLSLASSLDIRFENLPDCAEAALEAGHPEIARKYAEETLALAPQFPDERHRLDFIHDAHIVLGRLAVDTGDLDAACRSLRAAGEQGSAAAPVLRSFGPDFHLAGRLLKLGRTAAVLDYLDLCATFWRPSLVNRWRAEIESGRSPVFDQYAGGDEGADESGEDDADDGDGVDG